jgi:hypothetical protein
MAGGGRWRGSPGSTGWLRGSALLVLFFETSGKKMSSIRYFRKRKKKMFRDGRGKAYFR